MYISPYDTAVCRTHKISDLMQEIRREMIEGNIIDVDHNVGMVDKKSKHIKPFAHPVIVQNRDRSSHIVFDGRAAARINADTGEVHGGSDFQFMKLRSQLMSKVWIDGNHRDLLNAGDYQVKIFARLISDNLTKRMNLSANTQVTVNVITAMYYLHLFREEPLDNEKDYLGMASRVSRITAVPMDRVLSLTDEIESLMSIEDYCNALVKHSGSVRLEKLTPALLFTMLGGIWFGSNNVEVVATALEHPPTWCAILAMTINDRSYRKTVLGQLIQNTSRRDDSVEVFSKNILRIVK